MQALRLGLDQIPTDGLERGAQKLRDGVPMAFDGNILDDKGHG